MSTEQYDAVYLAPHLDDAVLSCGGQICRRTSAGERVLAVTIFAGDETTPSVFARRMHAWFGIWRGVGMKRRLEDRAAVGSLGAVHEHWPEQEALYRRDPATRRPLYASYRALVGPLQPADDSLIDRLARRLAGAVNTNAVFAPLAVGGHVDHRLVRAAAERAWPDGLRYYEDFPYGVRAQALAVALENADAWESEIVPVDERQLARKTSAIALYRSQIRFLFRSHRAMRDRVRACAAAVGGERVWRKRSARQC